MTKWWFQRFFLSQSLGKFDSQFDEHFFQMGWFIYQLDRIQKPIQLEWFNTMIILMVSSDESGDQVLKKLVCQGANLGEVTHPKSVFIKILVLKGFRFFSIFLAVLTKLLWGCVVTFLD